MEINTIILAAGKGKRMKSDLPKVLHKLAGKPMIEIVINTVEKVGSKNNFIVIGHKKELIENFLTEKSFNISFKIVYQIEQNGTGGAVLVCKDFFEDKSSFILILCGDMPLVKVETLKEFIKFYFDNSLDIGLISTITEKPKGYGRVVRENKKVIKIVEEVDASDKEKKIKEINTGIYLVKSELLFDLIKDIKPDNKQSEIYLTDIVEKGIKKGKKVDAFISENFEEFLGINNRIQLAEAENIIVRRKINELQNLGVTFVKPETSYIELDVEIGQDSIVYPNNVIKGKTKIGKKVVIAPNNILQNTVVKDNTEIKGFCVITESIIDKNCQIGPFSHIRPSTVIGSECKVGNFVEIKKSVLSKGVKASHLSYLGDSEIKEDVNIGAGTITCNYDGFKKYKTYIGKGVFIGSDTQLVAPVKIGDYSLIAAGTTVTKDVPENSLVHSRIKQTVIKNRGIKDR